MDFEWKDEHKLQPQQNLDFHGTPNKVHSVAKIIILKITYIEQKYISYMYIQMISSITLINVPSTELEGHLFEFYNAWKNCSQLKICAEILYKKLMQNTLVRYKT